MTWIDAMGWAQMETPLPVLIFRIVLAAILGGVIGFEREAHHRAAGLRTHILIATAAALYTAITFEIFYAIHALDGSSYGDPIRVVEAVTAGVAFLGAGAIFRGRAAPRGLTTGAGMWLAGAVGLASATGFYWLALLATFLGLIVLYFLRHAEHRLLPEQKDEPE